MINSERLTLRDIKEQDSTLLKETLLDENIMKYIPIPISEPSQIEKLLTSLIEAQSLEVRKNYFLVIEEIDSNQPIGTITAKIISGEIQNGIAVLGYTLLEKYWGKGYATEATKAFVSYGLNELKLHRIEASSVPENGSSEKVLKKVGMKYEGTKRKSLNINGIWYDELLYGILRKDISANL